MTELRKVFRVRDDVKLDVHHGDETKFGSALTGRIEHTLRQACQAIFLHRARYGMSDTVAQSRTLLGRAFDEALSELFENRRRLREECLFPAPEKVRPEALHVSHEAGEAHALALPTSHFSELARWLGEFHRGAPRPTVGAGRALFDALEAAGALVPSDASGDETRPPVVEGSAEGVFVGHATLLTASGARLLIDPFFLPRSGRYPSSYQPLQPRELGAVDAVLVTHSHPDHFDLGSLLALGAETPIYVPAVERESLLAIDMAARLEALGFERVERLAPGATATIGGAEVHALPFFGEQPTTGEVLHPEVRNQGLTYAITSAGARLLILADSGRDRDGDVLAVARAARARLGDFRAVVGGYRAFAIYPIHYLFSSVARYLLFVPEEAWTVRQKTMNDAEALLDSAEAAGARYAVPYADGGAPWYWERGLGPRLDGHGADHPAVDPAPEEVLAVAARRSSSLEGPIASPVQVLVARPGEAFTLTGPAVTRPAGPAQRWPYSPARWVEYDLGLVPVDGSALASARAVFAALEPELAYWRSSGALTCFFFMRKPPDLRLRFRGDGSFAAALERCFGELVERGHVHHFSAGTYEPELARFGGPAAMEAAHAFFDFDSEGWRALDRLRLAGESALPPDELCGAVAEDLAARLFDGPAERRALFERHARHLAAGNVRVEGSAPPVIALGALIANSHGRERALLEGYAEANRRLAEALRELERGDALTCGLRVAGQSVLSFHFHRHGLDGAAQARVTQRALAALVP